MIRQYPQAVNHKEPTFPLSKSSGTGGGDVRRTLVVFCSLVLVTSLLGAPRAAPDEGRTPAELSALQSQEQSVLAELFALNREREATLAEQRRLGQQQVDIHGHTVELKTKIEATEITLADLRRRLANRLRILQEQGKLNPFAILLGAESLSAFLDRLESVTLLMAHDQRLMTQVRTTQAELAQQQADLEANQERLTALALQAEATAARLAAEIAKRESILAGLSTERERLEAELSKLETAWAEVPPLLTALAETIKTSAAKADGFEPDEVSFSLFPPGATAVVTAGTLNKLIDRGLAFAFEPAGARLRGRLTGVEFELQGSFEIIERSVIRFTPGALVLNGVAVPPEVVKQAVAESPIQIDLERWITPFRLLGLTLAEGRLTVRAGL